MKRRELIKSLAMAALGAGACIIGTTDASAETIAGASPGGLAVGHSIQFDQGLKLTFVKVRNDNRRPLGAVGSKAGDAVVVLHAHLGTQPVRTYKLHTNKKPQYVAIPSWPPGTFGFKTYSVRLISLTPHRKIGKTLKQSDYRLNLDIDVAY